MKEFSPYTDALGEDTEEFSPYTDALGKNTDELSSYTDALKSTKSTIKPTAPTIKSKVSLGEEGELYPAQALGVKFPLLAGVPKKEPEDKPKPVMREVLMRNTKTGKWFKGKVPEETISQGGPIGEARDRANRLKLYHEYIKHSRKVDDVAAWKVLERIGIPSKNVTPDLIEAAKLGFGESTFGLRSRALGKAKEFKPITNEQYESMDIPTKFIFSLGQFVGSLPTYIAGGSVGAAIGGPVGAVGGAFGFDEGLRKYYMTLIEKGKANNIHDVVNIAGETIKGITVGKATEAAGAFGKSIGLPGAQTLSEAVALTTVPAALEARFPTEQDFIDTTIFLFGLKSPGAIKKLKDLWIKTGKTPKEVAEDTKTDPKLVTELADDKVELSPDIFEKAKKDVEEMEKVQATLIAENELSKNPVKGEDVLKNEMRIKGDKVKEIKETATVNLSDLEKAPFIFTSKKGNKYFKIGEKWFNSEGKEISNLFVINAAEKGKIKKAEVPESKLGTEEKGVKPEATIPTPEPKTSAPEPSVKNKDHLKIKQTSEPSKIEKPKVEKPKPLTKDEVHELNRAGYPLKEIRKMSIEEQREKLAISKGQKIEPSSYTAIDETTGSVPKPKSLELDNHPFRDKDTEMVNIRKDMYLETFKKGRPDIETAVGYLRNEVNRYLNGAEDVKIEKVRNTLTDLASRVDEYALEFEQFGLFESWKNNVIELAKWARKADRSKIKRPDVRLNVMIPLDEVPKRVKDIIDSLITAGEDLLRNYKLWKETGFWFGADGMKRYEILRDITEGIDEQLLLRTADPKNDNYKRTVKLKDVIKDEELFKAVPALELVEIRLNPDLSGKGKYNQEAKLIDIKYDLNNKKLTKENRESIIHETQHAIDKFTGSPFEGTNMESVREKVSADFIKQLKEVVKSESVRKKLEEIEIDAKLRYVPITHYEIISNMSEALNRIDKNSKEAKDILDILDKYKEKTAYKEYLKDPGEMESRVSTIRSMRSIEENLSEPPWETLDKMLEKEGLPKEAGHNLYSGIDPIEAIKKLSSAIKTIQSRFGTKTIRINPEKVEDKLKPIAQGGNEFMDSFEASRDAKRFDLYHFVDRLKFHSIRAIHEQASQLRNGLIKHYGIDGYKVMQFIDAEQASDGRADRMYYEMRKEAFDGVPSKLTVAVDAVDLVNRLMDIYKYKSPKEFKAPKGMSPTNTAIMENLIDVYFKLTPEERAIAEQASKTMSDHVRKWVDEMVRVELKTPEEGEILKSHKYRKIKNLDVQNLYDYKENVYIGDKLIRSSDSGIDFLANTPITLIETDSRILYKETANRIFRRISNQEARLAMEAFDAKHKDNPFFIFPKNDAKENRRKIPNGWIKDYYFKKGKLSVYFMHPDVAIQLLAKGPHMDYALSNFLSSISGVKLTRDLTVSTSVAWATTRGLAMDIAATYFNARRIVQNPDGTVSYPRVYKAFAPVFMSQIGKDMKEVFSDTLHRGPLTGIYAKNGGMMPFLTMREQHFLGKGMKIPGKYDKIMDALSYWGQSMEMLNRVAVMNRVIKQLAKEKGITYEEALKDRDITMEATNVAVERLPYRQGGWLVKEIDKIAGPFISAGYNAARVFGRSIKENPVEYAARLANIAIPTIGITIGMAICADEIDRDIPEYEYVGSIVIPLPFDIFKFTDNNGDERYIYLKIPVDPNVAFHYNVLRLATKKMLYEYGLIDNEPNYESVVDSITRSLPVDSPVSPTVSAWMAYFGNVNTWRFNKITEKTFPYPKSAIEEFYNPEIGQLPKDVASVTGLSAPRLKAMVKQFGLPNNEYAWLFGRLYDKAMSDVDPKIKEEHNAVWLSKVPGFKNLFGVTKPRAYRASGRYELTIDESFEDYVRNGTLDAEARALYWDKVGSEQEIEKYIDSFEDPLIRDSLEKKRKFWEKTASLPHRDNWVNHYSKSLEWKAKDYYEIWKRESSPEDRRKLAIEYDELIEAGYIPKESEYKFENLLDDLKAKE